MPITLTPCRRTLSPQKAHLLACHSCQPLRRRSSHLADASATERLTEDDEALKNELHRLEASDDAQFQHPIGFSWLAALRILNAPADPVLNNTGYWIQPEDLDDVRISDELHACVSILDSC